MNERLVLASQSPQRRQLLLEAGYTFEVVPPHPAAECGLCSRESPPEMAARLAYQKAISVAAGVPRGIVIGCDTVAECCGQILGKPRNRGHARQMLHLLRGREHRVYSGLCLVRQPGQHVAVDVAVTRLYMRCISDGEIERYLDTNLWEGKAGAFGLQDRIGWIEVLEGSHSNVVGLPLELLASMLKQWDP